MTALLSKDALEQAFMASEEFKAFAVKFQANQAQAMTVLYTVESLGASFTLPQIAVLYQGLKGTPKSLESAWAKTVSDECKNIIKKAGFQAGWEGIKSLVSHEPKA